MQRFGWFFPDDNEKKYERKYVKFYQRRGFARELIMLEFYYSSNKVLEVHEVNNDEVIPEVYEIVTNTCNKYKGYPANSKTLYFITEEIKDSLSNLPDITLI